MSFLNDKIIYDLRWPLKNKGQGQTLKSLKSNVSKLVLSREDSEEVRANTS